jgi:hypothetical protein
MAGAVVLAEAFGVPPGVAAPLLAACADGLALGMIEKARLREQDEAAPAG